MSIFNISFNKEKDNLLFDYNNTHNLDFSLKLEDNSFNNYIYPWSGENQFFNGLSEENILNNDSSFNILDVNKRKELENKSKLYFITEKEIPNPFLEKDIILKIKHMNIGKEKKVNYISAINKKYHQTEKIKEKIILNPKERRKKVVKDNKTIDIKPTKSGRKKGNDISIRSHDKYSTDNIINKIKNLINISLVLFCNKIINSLYPNKKHIFSSMKLSNKISKKKVIKDINYSFIKQKKKADEILELLNMSIKDYLCQNISLKYANIPNNYNELVINQLFLDENNRLIFEFIFKDLKIEDWFNIFLYQKEFKDFIKFNSFNKEEQKLLNENIVRIDDYLDKIYAQDEIYFLCLVILIYNFKRFLLIKEKRSRNMKEV